MASRGSKARKRMMSVKVRTPQEMLRRCIKKSTSWVSIARGKRAGAAIAILKRQNAIGAGLQSAGPRANY